MLEPRDIRQKLPHRFPMLLVDRVLESSAERIVGEKYVTANEPFFRGHFPSAPVMPGVLIMESLFQLLWLNWGGEHGFHLCGVKRLKFRRSVVPGDRLSLEVLRTDKEDCFRCVARVEEKVAAEGELRVRPRNELSGNFLR